MDEISVFLNGERGLAVLRKISRAGHGISCVIVPAKYAHDRQICAICRECSAELLPVKNVNEPSFIAEIVRRHLNVSIVAGYSTIIAEPLLTAPKHGTINLHAGRLPQYRGGSPLNWQLANGEKLAGLSIIQVDAGIDTGDVLAEAEIEITPQATISDLHREANLRFPKLVLDVVSALEEGTLKPRKQDSRMAAYWHQRNDADGRIDWQNSAMEIYNLVRAVTRPYPGAFCSYDGRQVRIFGTTLPSMRIRGFPGRVLRLQGKGPYVVCGEGALMIDDYEIEGGAELMHGAHLN